jgi:hypothetical protein
MDRQKLSLIIASLAPETSDLALDRLLSPSRFFKHPDDVLKDDTLDLQEKRAILSSWASDACAVESIPALRQPPGAEQPIFFRRDHGCAVSARPRCIGARRYQVRRATASTSWMPEGSRRRNAW